MDPIQNDNTQTVADEVVETTPETIVEETTTPEAVVTEETPAVEAAETTEEVK
jgi:hypothetical protein